MQMTRKGFIGGAAALASLATVRQVVAADRAGNPFRAEDYSAFRRELRSFYPDECHQPCKDPRQTNSVAAIGRELDTWCAAHPGYDALDVRREEYLSVRRNVQPFLFRTSPFYFELGCNGGWTHSDKTVPGRHVNRLCRRFYREKNLIPDSAFALLDARQRSTLALCCGPFVDDMHHVPPFRTIIEKGFRGVRDEVAAALDKCPADDPLGRKELETALVGLETIHAIQIAFCEEARRMLESAADAEERKNLLRIAESAARCPWEPPRTFYEGLNTLWFVREVLGYLDGTDQFSLGRPDCYFIDIYRKDIAEGRLTEGEARDLVAKFLLTAELHHDGLRTLDGYNDHEMEIPMSVGGFAPDGKFVYNELTDMILDAHLGCGCVFPKMHARISAHAPEPYLEKIGRMLMEGHAVFTLLNDDRFVKQFADEGYPIEDARSYIGVGCWNGMIDSAPMSNVGRRLLSTPSTAHKAMKRCAKYCTATRYDFCAMSCPSIPDGDGPMRRSFRIPSTPCVSGAVSRAGGTPRTAALPRSPASSRSASSTTSSTVSLRSGSSALWTRSARLMSSCRQSGRTGLANAAKSCACARWPRRAGATTLPRRTESLRCG